MKTNSFTVLRWQRGMLLMAVLLMLTLTQISVYAQSDGLPRGAYQMPYKRYEATAASVGGGATMLPVSYDQTLVQSEATDRTCANLSGANSYVNWTTTNSGNGLVIRYSIPDAPGGGGQTGTLALYVNNTFVRNITVTSKWSWQYFAKPQFGDPNIPSNVPNANYTTRMRFDEVRVSLANTIPAGANVRLQKGSDGINYAVDFIELEPIPAAVQFNASTMRNITEWGAIPNDGIDDMNAFNSARLAMQNSGQTLYIGPGRWDLGQTWHIQTNISIQGAGMWYTTLYFTSPSTGGIVGNGDNVILRDFHMNTENTTRNEYKGLTGGYGNNSIIERLWIEHFETSAWITTWTGQITNGLRVSHCRFRNNYADGINFCRGSSNCIVEHSDMRNNGDDALATWSASDGPQMCLNNEFRYITVENTWRAGGIGFFGGGGHKGHHLLIKDGVENGIRINSDFPVVGNGFHATLWTEVSETTVIGCGTNANLWHNRYGAVDIFTRMYDVKNFRLRNVDILSSQKDAILIYDVGSSYTISNVEFQNVTVNGAGLDGNDNNYTSGTYDDYEGYGIYVLSDVLGGMSMTGVNICNAPSGQIRNDSQAGFTINGTAGSTCSGNTNNNPVVSAGADQNLSSGTTSANLTGSATDANGDPLTYSWSQVSGPSATITNASNAATSVTGLSNGNVYVFRLTVTDGKGGSGADDVQISVGAAPCNLASPWATSDIGAVAAAGSGCLSSGTFTVRGSGADIWDAADEFRYVYQQVSGDVTITARVATLQNTNVWAKAGVMIRSALTAGSQHASTVVTPSNGVNFQRRVTANGASSTTSGGGTAAPYWVRVQRVGNTFTSSISANGTTWTTVGSATISMSTAAYVGLAVTSHSDGVVSTATFDNVSVVPGGGNQAPTANAGTDQNLSAGTTSTTLTGSGTDPNGTPVTFSWSKISGPAATIVSPSNASTSVTGLTNGSTYVFRLSVSDGSLSTTDDVTVSVQSGGQTQSPYPGPAAHAIPGTIEFENFDTGGEGVAYHDNESANQGGQGRLTEGVDTENCSEGGLNIGWTGTGEWYEYTVNVAQTGNYNIDVRTASIFAGGTFHIEFNGVDKTGLFTTTNTGAWQTWTTVSKTGIALTAGTQVMRVFLDNANFNLNRMTFTTAGCTPTTITPYIAVNGGTLQQTSSASLAAGGSIRLSPSPTSGGSWSWTGPNGFTSSSREVNITNITTAQGGTYVATYTNTSGCTSTQNHTVTVTGGGGSAYRIKNRWQNTYLYDGGDRVRYSATASGTTYNWVLEDVGNGQREIKNVSTGEYMHIENLTGYVQCTARTAGWMSSRWTTEDAGSGFIRLKNVWQPSNYIHVENLAGHAQHGTINTAWMSAQWVLEPVSGRMDATPTSEFSESVVSSWPNPVEDQLHLNTDGSFESLDIMDLVGRRYVSLSVKGQHEIAVDVRSLASGLHFVKLKGPASSAMIRIIKK